MTSFAMERHGRQAMVWGRDAQPGSGGPPRHGLDSVPVGPLPRDDAGHGIRDRLDSELGRCPRTIAPTL